MEKLSQSKKVVEFLKKNANQKFTARQIAEAIVEAYPADYQEKRKNPRFTDRNAFITQIVAEIGSQKDSIVKSDRHVFWQDKPRPRVYWYDLERQVSEIDSEITKNSEVNDEIDEANLNTLSITSKTFTEKDLYPILISYLKSELKLFCQRINEKRSKNSRGMRGNQWLHPDIVAMQPIDKEWHELVRSCVQQSSGQRVRLWSFEVKKELNNSNIRKSFFQAVSNSSWANQGYLVTTSIANNTEKELRMLSELHGIGVILLNPENPSESDRMLPSKSREIDWESVNRILTENEDFKNFIELVSMYYQTRILRSRDWNKI